MDRFVRLDPSRHLPATASAWRSPPPPPGATTPAWCADAAPGKDPPGLRASLEFAAP